MNNISAEARTVVKRKSDWLSRSWWSFKRSGLPSLFGIFLVLAVVAGCSSISLDEVPPERSETAIRIANNKFSPRVIEVAPGTTVTWLFEDGNTTHDVKGNGWGSKRMKSGVFVHSFDAPGTYDYLCTLHGGMTGRVVVTGSPRSS